MHVLTPFVNATLQVKRSDKEAITEGEKCYQILTYIQKFSVHGGFFVCADK